MEGGIMAFCANCGASLPEGAGFCSGCGKSAASGAGGTGAATAPAQAATPAMTSNVAGALTYLLGFITGIVFLVLDQYKTNRFVRFHAMQSIFYSGSCIIVLVAWGVLWSALFAVTGSLSLVLAPVWIVLRLAMFVYWLYLMYQAYNNREYRIPFIGDLAAKQVGQ
jgi:uncharacterized membrane protein